MVMQLQAVMQLTMQPTDFTEILKTPKKAKPAKSNKDGSNLSHRQIAKIASVLYSSIVRTHQGLRLDHIRHLESYCNDLSRNIDDTKIRIKRLKTLHEHSDSADARHNLGVIGSTIHLCRSTTDIMSSILDQMKRQATESAHRIYEDLFQLDKEFGLRYRERAISIRTDDIVFEGINLGDFDICLNIDTLEIYAVAQNPNPASMNHYITHPHVKNRHICMGGHAVEINMLLMSGVIYELFDMLYRLLNTYNEDEPYQTISNWHEYEDAQSCSECGDEYPEEDMLYSERYEAYLCTECGICLDDGSAYLASECELVGSTWYHEDDIETCPICDDRVHTDDYDHRKKRCLECSKLFEVCEKCQNEVREEEIEEGLCEECRLTKAKAEAEAEAAAEADGYVEH